MLCITYAANFLAMISCACGLKMGLKVHDDAHINFRSETGRVHAGASTYTFTLSSTVCGGVGGKIEVLTGPSLDQSGGEVELDASGRSFTVSQATISIKYNNDCGSCGGGCDRNVALTYSDGTFAASHPVKFSVSNWNCDGASPDTMRCNAVKAGSFRWSGTYTVTFTFTGASGDPKAVNVRGEKFDIQRLGTYNFLAITNASDFNSRAHDAGMWQKMALLLGLSQPVANNPAHEAAQLSTPLMSLDATVGRAGPSCDHTYILNLTLSGTWIQEATPTKIEIRAVPDRLKTRAIEMFFKDEWHELSEIKKNREQLNMEDLNILQTVTAEALVLNVHGIKIAVSVDSHRIRPTMKYANFLNVDVKGMNQLMDKDGIRLHGLLAYDDHAFAEEAPDDCKIHSGKRQLLVNDIDSQPALTSMTQPALMSVVRLSS